MDTGRQLASCHWYLAMLRAQEVRASCHKLSQSLKPVSTIVNPNQSGYRRNGVNMTSYGRRNLGVRYQQEKSVAVSLLNEKVVTLTTTCHVPVPADEGDQLVWDGNTTFSSKLE